MANLTRYKQKIFAGNSNQIGVFGTGVEKQTSTNVETLQSADYEDGWSAAVVTNKNYPVLQERDGVDYGFSYQLAYMLQKGIPEWLSTETYYANTSFCQYGGKIYQSLQDNNTNHNPALNDGYWTPLLTSNRSIGEIIPSCIPLTEAGLHLLDGALISNGIYSEFITYVGGLSATYPDLFCTEAQWQQSVTDYGVCGKFVYDSVNNTVRLPKVTGIIEGTTDVTALGDLVEAGLPNITGEIRANVNLSTINPQGAFSATSSSYGSGNGLQAVENVGNSIGINASRSSSIYGNSTTVQPQTTKVLYYIVIATSAKTQIQVDIDEIATDLNGKADVDLSNCTKPHIVETYQNGSSWYRVYSDGWCEQGGNYQGTNITNHIINLLVNFKDTTYTTFMNTNYTIGLQRAAAYTVNTNKTVDHFQVYVADFAPGPLNCDWLACGYIR